MAACVLVTGGAGYIGSHACVALIEAGWDVLVLDNFCNSSPASLQRVGEICGRAPQLIRGDLRDRACLDGVFAKHDVAAVMHFAGLKAVGESVEQPLAYYDANVTGTLTRRFSPSRSNTGCGRTFTVSTMSPGSPPSGDGWPLPRSRIF